MKGKLKYLEGDENRTDGYRKFCYRGFILYESWYCDDDKCSGSCEVIYKGENIFKTNHYTDAARLIDLFFKIGKFYICGADNLNDVYSFFWNLVFDKEHRKARKK